MITYGTVVFFYNKRSFKKTGKVALYLNAIIRLISYAQGDSPTRRVKLNLLVPVVESDFARSSKTITRWRYWVKPNT